MTQEFWKLGMMTSEGVSSFAAWGKWNKFYLSGTRVTPDKGYLYAFDSYEAAQSYLDFIGGDWNVIMRGRGELVTKEPRICLRESLFDDFWDNQEKSDELSLDIIAEGAVGIAWFELEEVL